MTTEGAVECCGKDVRFDELCFKTASFAESIPRFASAEFCRHFSSS